MLWWILGFSTLLHSIFVVALPSSVHMKVGEDVVLETFRDQLGHKSTVAGENP